MRKGMFHAEEIDLPAGSGKNNNLSQVNRMPDADAIPLQRGRENWGEFP